MKPRLIQSRKCAILTIVLGFLLLILLPETKLYSQQIKKTDSTFASLEGTQTEIDSVIKILNDYPDLKQQYEASKNIIKNERRIANIEQTAILMSLHLPAWDIDKVVKAIRKYKRRGFWNAVKYGFGGFVAGVVATVFALAK